MRIGDITAINESPELIAKFVTFCNELVTAYDKLSRAEIQTFVKKQVAEITKVRANMPNDQLAREIIKRAIQAGLNKGILGPTRTTADLIKELVPTIDRTVAPKVDTSAPKGLGAAPTIDATDGPETDGDNAEVEVPDSPIKPVAPKKGNAPNVDAAQVAQQMNRFQKLYGMGTGGDGLPTLFRDKFLRPALGGEYKSAPWVALTKELAGEIPQAVARNIVQQIVRWHGSDIVGMKGDLQSLMPDKGDPEVDDQIKTITLMIALVEKLTKDAARK
jgi:hypothetical protein